ncbi:MAG: RDD family protein [Candidatus Dormibacteraeota bacterium]|nr:RDD family protein [Candidatus Dormibacteraeota bacterium]
MTGAPVTVRDEVRAPSAPSPDALRDGYFTGTARAMFGLIRFSQNRFRLGPLTLFQFGAPRFQQPAWVFPIEGGLLARRPAGAVRVGWKEERLYSLLEDYQPRLPRPIFRLTQFRFHREISRIALFQIRGRTPSAGVPAEPWRRLLAGLLDAGVAASIAATRAPLRAGTRAALGAATLIATQTVVPALTGGITPGGWVTGIRITGVDGSRVHLAQLLLRTLALPLGVRTLRDRHDELAGTEAVLSRTAPAE